MAMTPLVFVVAAAAATLLRAVATVGQTRGRLPWRTLATNTVGSFALGFVLTSGWLDNPLIVTVAGLGSFTTFSTVVAETSRLLDDRQTRLAIAYVGLSLLVGVAAAWLGLRIGDT